jgi:alanine transaminase
MELHNIDPFVQTQLYKLASSGLCSGVAGQMMMSLMVRPPLPHQESYELFAKEENAIFGSLKRRAVSVSDDIQYIYTNRSTPQYLTDIQLSGYFGSS